jgi:peptidyl-prolyl cis-trans isomerase SurA
MHIKILNLMLFSILFFSLVLPAQGSILLDKVVAIVNKEAITWSDLYKTMEFEITESGRNLNAEEKRRFFKENETPFLEILIDMRLQLQEAQRTGIFVSPEEVERAIKSIKDKYSMTDEVFVQTLKKEGFTLDEYRKKLNEKITAGRLIDQEVKSRIIIDEESITHYISQHKELSGQYEGYNLSHIFLKKTTDRFADEEKARQIYNKLKAGEAFPKMAAQYSEDAAARTGGELGLINRADLSREFSEAISKMKAEDISEPFWTDKGIHILRLNAIVSTEKSAQLREQVRQKLAEEKFMKVYKNWLKGLRERAYIQILIKPY